MKDITGTSYFVSERAAIKYYSDYGDNAASVARKIKEGQIHIGQPVYDRAKYSLHVIKGEGRYSLHSKGES